MIDSCMSNVCLGFLGTPEWIVIGIVAVLLFGKRLPELGRWLGRSLVEFKKGVHDVNNEFSRAVQEADDESRTPPKNLPAPDSESSAEESAPDKPDA